MVKSDRSGQRRKPEKTRAVRDGCSEDYEDLPASYSGRFCRISCLITLVNRFFSNPRGVTRVILRFRGGSVTGRTIFRRRAPMYKVEMRGKSVIPPLRSMIFLIVSREPLRNSKLEICDVIAFL